MRNALGKFILILLVMMAALPLSSQEMLGIVTGVYSGSNGAGINPASIANSPMKFDINLFTLHGHLAGNYFYLPSGEASLVKVFNGNYDFPDYPKPYGNGSRKVLSNYPSYEEKFSSVNVRLTGPSALFSLGSHVFAFHTAFRVAGSMRRLPYDVTNFSYYGLDYYPQHNIEFDRRKYDLAAMAWWETGISYATVLSRNGNRHWSAGITLNYILGYAGAYAISNQTRYIAYNDSILNVINLDAELGFSLPVDYETDETDFLSSPFRGRGAGVDLGVSYQYSSTPYRGRPGGIRGRKYFDPYDVKIGFSLLDLGIIRFTRNAERHIFDNVGNPYINVEDLTYDNIRNELDETSRLLYGDPGASLKENRIRIFLPAALSLQADYHYAGPWYFNSTLVVPLRITRPMVERTTMIAFNPRFESKNFTVQLPFLVNDFHDVRLGLAVRIFGLTVGSERMGAFFGLNDFNGMDLYVSYKVNVFYRDSRHGSRKDPCDTF